MVTFYPSYLINSTLVNVTESKTVHITMTKPLITFNVTSGEDGSPLDNVNIVCNYTGFNQGGDTTNTYGPYEFPPGWWNCTFEKTDYYDKTIIFNANSDQTINVKLSYELSLTIEEHNWLESIYNCLINKDCDVYDLWNQTYEYASDIWDQFKQTDESVVVSEQTTSSVVNATSNLTIEYLIDVPAKEDYKFLPIRIFYWFMDEDNETCYNQVKETNSAEAPFCNPLVAQTIGEVNTQINFTVELRPSLPAGNYTVVRRIDIDPQDVANVSDNKSTGANMGPEINASNQSMKMCVSFDLKCEGNSLMECAVSGAEWAVKQACEFGCDNDKCKERPLELGFVQNYLWLLVPIVIVAVAAIGAVFKIKRHAKIGG